MQDVSDYVSISLLFKISVALIIRYFLGLKVGRVVLKSQNLVPQGNGRDRLKPSLERNNVPNFEYHYVMTMDNIIVDTVEINPGLKNSPRVPHVIRFNGNSMTYHDHLQHMIETANDMGVVYIAFDYPNVGHSGSIRLYSQQPLVNAGIAQVQRLLNRGVAPSQINLDGSSLGGAIATLVADYFYHQNPSIQLRLINDRSFSSVAGVVSSMIGTQNLNLLIKPALYLVGWEVNAVAAFHRLPEESKMVLFSKHDTTINYENASLHIAVKDILSKEQTYEIVNGPDLEHVHQARRDLLRNENDEKANHMVKKFVTSRL